MKYIQPFTQQKIDAIKLNNEVLGQDDVFDNLEN